MLFSFNLKSSILLIFFFHGIVFSVLLFIKGKQTDNKSSFWLSLFTLLGALYIAPFMLGYAGWYSKQPYRDVLFYIPFQQLFLLPPVLYFYFRTLLDKSFKFSKKDDIHFIPAIIYLIYSLIIFLTDNVILNEYYFYEDGRDKDFSFWYQVLGFLSLIYYLIRSLKTYFKYRSITYNTLSFADSVLFNWNKRFLIVFITLITIRLIFFIVNPEWDEFGKKFWYYLSFSILLYYVSIIGYTNSIISVTSFKEPAINTDIDSINDIESDSNLPSIEQNVLVDLEIWKEKIMHLMLIHKIYKNPELTILDISNHLNTHSKKISQVINQGFNMNFNDYINHHRIETLLQKIEEGEHHTKTLLGLALECGFNSKSTFNRAFKRVTSMNPKDYIEKKYPKK